MLLAITTSHNLLVTWDDS